MKIKQVFLIVKKAGPAIKKSYQAIKAVKIDKQQVKGLGYIALILAAFLITGTMDYNDAVAQQKINNQSATWVADNSFICEEK